MYSQEDIIQPRDRRAWTEEEDELLRSAIEQGTHAHCHRRALAHSHPIPNV